MNYKNSKAARTTITRNLKELTTETEGNIYEAINIISKRANQISKEMKEELSSKLNDFAMSSDNLEEVFENREQIEISKFYEKLPKPLAISMDEFQEHDIYFRENGEK